MSARPAVPVRLEEAAKGLAAAAAAVHQVPGGRGRNAGELVYEAWRTVRQMPEIIRVFNESTFADDSSEFHTFERVVHVQAFRLKERALVETRKGLVIAEVGQWVARDKAGGFYTIDEDVFQAEGCRQID